jgi:isopentenyl-diphosphate delta-isomerase
MTKETELRKRDHISICLEKDVGSGRSNGFEKYDLVHNALPEASLEEIDLSTSFFGKGFRLPFFIEGMTGGSPGTEKINRNLAGAAHELGIGMGLGSQRAMLEDPDTAYTYMVRDAAPDIFLLGNIGAVQLQNYSVKEISGLVSGVKADGLAVHLNAAQELSQPEGDNDWRDVISNITKLCRSGFPVIVKETGCGISAEVASILEKAGVSAIDVAGVGGTSWTMVEHHRGSDTARTFRDWGIPTAESLRQCRQAVSLPLVASGGMRTGLDCAKAMAMGASLAGFALPLLKPAMESQSAVELQLKKTVKELKKAMLLVGARNINELSRARISKR